MKNKRKVVFISLIVILGIVFSLFYNMKTVNTRKEQAKVENTNASTLVSTVKPEHYGMKVNYSVTVNGTTLNDWKIFYNDGSHVYIILSDYLPNSLAPTATGIVTNGSYNVYSNSNRTTLLNYLSTASNWSNFAKGVSGATATGAPTADMLIKSYNAKHGGNYTVDYNSGNTRFYNVFGNSSSGYDELYVPHNAVWNSSYGYWLASAYPDYADIVWNVHYNGYLGYYYYDNHYCAARPVVSLPSDISDTIAPEIKPDFSLTIDPNGGKWNSATSNSTVTMKTGETRTIENPTRTGYTFGGWTLSGTGSTMSGTTFTMGSANATLTAKWTADQYKITLDNQSATYAGTAEIYEKYGTGIYLDSGTSTMQMSTSGNPITPPTKKYTVTYNHNDSRSNTTKDAQCTFGGYYTQANGGGVQMIAPTGYITTNFANTQFAAAGTLYAKWTNTNVNYVPTREGYTFLGWFENPTGGTRVDTDGNYTPTSNKTLYAHWTANTYTIEYNGNGATSGTTASSTHTYDVEKALTNNGFTRTYNIAFNYNYSGGTTESKTATYTFKNWTYNGNVYGNGATVKNLAQSGTITMVAQWEGGNVSCVPTREGYTFLGWFETASGGTRVDTNGNYTPTASKTLYAHWLANTYTIEYDGNGATSGSTASSTHTYDVEQALPFNGFARSYNVTFDYNYVGGTTESKTATYTFKNWTFNGNTYENRAMVKNLATSGTIKMVAQWNSASVGSLPTREGYKFLGWFEAPTGGTRVDTDGNYTPTSNKTLYAQWAANTYTIAYDGNGATSGTTANSNHTIDESKSLTTNGYKREYKVTFDHNYTGSTSKEETVAYTFNGWSKTANGIKEYNDGQSVTNLTMEAGTQVTLFANWSEKTTNYLPTRTGYTFGGWYIDAACTGERVDTNGTYLPTKETTLFAKWTVNNYKYIVNYLEKDTNKVLADVKADTSKSFGTSIKGSDEAITINGYKVVSSNDIVISEVEGNNIINIYYEIDEEQTKTLNYTVEYYKNGQNADTDTVTETVQVLHDDNLTVKKNEINLTNKYVGYRLEKTEPGEIPDTVETGSVIKVYYIIDDSNTKTLSYTVEYYQDGEKVDADTKTVTETVQVLQPDTLTVQPVDTANNKYTGYKFEKTEPATIPSKINDGSTIKVYYVTDEGQTKTLSYTVEYYKNGEKVDVDTQVESTTVQVLEPDTLKVAKEKINLNNKYITFKLDRTEPGEIPDVINNGSTIKVYYVTNEEKTAYKIEYYYDNEIDSSRTEQVEINKGTTVTKEDIASKVDTNKKAGYKLLTVLNTPLEAEDDLNLNTIKVHYIKEKIEVPVDPSNPDGPKHEIDNPNVAYRLEYYYDNKINTNKTEIIECEVGNTISRSDVEGKITANTESGYKLLDCVNAPLNVTSDVENNVIKIFYKNEKVQVPVDPSNPDGPTKEVENTNLGYRIEYYYDYEKDNSRTEMVEIAAGTIIAKETVAEKVTNNNEEGYKLLEIVNAPLQVSAKVENNVIKIFYISEKVQVPVDPSNPDGEKQEVENANVGYRVEYYYDYEKDNSRTEMVEAAIDETIAKSSIEEKANSNILDGYGLLTIINTPLKVNEEVENNVIKVYYVKQETLETKTGYRVEYYYDNNINNDKTKLYEADKNSTISKEEISVKAKENVIEEYKVLSIINAPLQLTENVENNIIKVYYVKQKVEVPVDPSNPDGEKKEEDNNTSAYRIEYYYENEKDNNRAELVEAENGATITKKDVNANVEKNKVSGYKVLSIVNTPLEVNNDIDNNVIKVYYVREDNNKAGYKIEYYYDGIMNNAKAELVQVDKGTTVSKEDVSSIAVANKLAGYKLLTVLNVPLVVGEEIESNVVKAYFIKENITVPVDPSNPDGPKHEVENTNVGYRIEYYYDNEMDNRRSELVEAEVGNIVSRDNIDANVKANTTIGYKLLSVVNAPLEISENVENNVIKVYYVGTENNKGGYRIEYYYDNKIDNTKSQLVEADKGTTITKLDVQASAEANVKAGYKLLTIVNAPVEVSETIENNVIKIFYAKETITVPVDPNNPDGPTKEEQNDRVAYRIEYYYENKINNSKTSVVEEKVGTIVTDEDIDSKIVSNKLNGYKLLTIVNTPLTVEENMDENVIKVYYTKSENSKVGYRIEYYYDNKLDNSKTELIPVEIGTTVEKAVIESKAEANKKENYRVLTILNTPLEVSEAVEENVVKVYYEQYDPENPDKPLDTSKAAYRIEYYYNNKIDSSKTELIYVEKETSIEKADIESKAEAKKKTGYKLLTILNAPLKVSESIENNVIKVYYIKYDPENPDRPLDTTKLPYIVEYYYDNEIDNSKTALFEVSRGTSVEKSAVEGKAESNKKDGYKLLTIVNVPLTPEDNIENNVIKVYYIKENDTKVGYSIEYYYNGVKNNSITEVLMANVNDEITRDMIASNIEAHKTADCLEVNELNLTLTIKENTEENVIKVYYVVTPTEADKTKYSIEYYYDYEIDEARTTKVDDIRGNIISDAKITENVETNKAEGYILSKIENTPLLLSRNAQNNVVKVYYAKRTDLSYTIKYVDSDGKELKTPVTVENQTFNEKVTVNATEIEGYNVDAKQKSTVIGVNTNEIVFTYTKKNDLSYTVKYLEKDTEGKLAEEKLVENKTFQETVTEQAIDIAGYNKVDPVEKSIEIKVSGNEIIFYYTKRTDLSYTVKYLLKDGDNDNSNNKVLHEEKVENNKTFKETIKETAIDIDGYNVIGSAEATLTIGAEANEIIFFYSEKSDLVYTVKYLDASSNAELSPTKSQIGQVFGTQVTENAIDIEGYNKPEQESQTITIGTETNEIIFYYNKRTDLSYTVKYLEKDTNKELASIKTVPNRTFQETIREEAINIEGYDKVTPIEKTIEIKVIGNEITFYYTKRTDLSYTVRYLEKDNDNDNSNNKVLHDDKVVGNQQFKATVSESAIDIEGYNKLSPIQKSIEIAVSGNEIIFYYTTRSDLSYTVRYLEETTNNVLAPEKTLNNQQFGKEIVETAIDIVGYDKPDPAEQTINIKVSGNEVVFYYTKRKDLSYTVKFLEQSTGAEVAKAKVVSGRTYQETITEKAIDVSGYEKVAPEEQSITIGVNKNEIAFYYTKRMDLSYTVKYLDEDTEEEIAPAKVVGNQQFNSRVSEKAIDVAGFNKITPTEQTIVIDVENNLIKFYYVKRTDLSYTVKYLDQETGEEVAPAKVVNNQTFGATVKETATDFAGYNKVGEVEGTITIGGNTNEITFYYTKKKDLSYTVKYLEQNTNTELATTKTVENQVFGTEVTEKAVDIEGYDKVNPTEFTIRVGAGKNEITFYYTKRTNLSYIVKYLEKDTEKELADSKTVENKTFKETVKEIAIDIDGYNKVDPSEKTIEIGVSGNEIKFYYTKRTDLSYTVNYLEKDSNKVLHDAKVANEQTFETVITSKNEVIEIDGYNFDSTDKETLTLGTKVEENVINIYYTKVDGLSYKVNYLDKATNEVIRPAKVQGEQVFDNTINAADEVIEIEGYNYDSSDKQSIKITTSENVLNLYYTKRTDLSYTVKYMEKDTTTELAEAKTVGNKTFKETVSEQAIEIVGYDKVAPTEKELTIAVSGNEIIFYYTKRANLSYTVRYLEKDTNTKLSEEKVVSNQVFKAEITETAIDIEGYNKVDPSEKTIEIGVSGNEITFYYTKRTDLSYTVKYLEQETNAELAGSKTVGSKTFKELVTETAIDIEGYNKVAPTEKSIEMAVSGNEIKFYYTKRTDLSYTVKYLERDTEKELAQAKVVGDKTFKELVTEQPIDIVGYNKVDDSEKSIEMAVSGNEIKFYYTKKTDLSYTVKYLEKDVGTELASEKTVKNQAFEAEIIEKAIDIEGYNKVDPSEQTIKIAVEGNTITFYYSKRTDLSYTVKYLEKDTEKELAQAKVVGDKTFKETVKETAIDIDGYNKVEEIEKSIEMAVSGNEIKFYYSKKTDLSYTVKYLEKDTETELASEKTVEDQVFEAEITEKAIDIEGYNKVEPSEQTIKIAVEGNEIKFYYTKRTDLSYTVKYLEKDTEKELAQAKVVGDKTFKELVTEQPIDIVGYNKVDDAEKSIEIGVSGNEITFYYTKRTDLSYTVNYLEKDSNKVLHDAKVANEQIFETVILAKDEVIEIDGYNFDSTDKEQITITTGENVINVYYTKVSGLSYKVNYLDKATGEVIHPAKVKGDQVFESVINAENEVIGIEGYNFDSSDKSSITITTGENILNLYYTKRTDLSYTVKYLEKDTDAELASIKTVENKTFKETIKETAIDIEGYDKVAPTEKELTIAVSGNEIIFYYTKRTNLSYTVKYLEKDTNVELADSKTVGNKTFKETVKEVAIDIEGYNKVDETEKTIEIGVSGNEIVFYYMKKTDLGYTVKYLEKDTDVELASVKTVENKTFKETVTEKAIDIEGYDKVAPAEKSIEIGVSGNEIIFYYTKRTNLSYTVKYLEKNTEKEVADSKTVGNKTFKETVTETAIDVEGYNKVDETEKSIEIQVSGNEITFYYMKRTDLSYTVKYLEKDTNTELAGSKTVENKTFEELVTETAIDVEGYNKVDPAEKDLIIAVSGNEIKFYYTKRTDLSYTVKYLEKDTESELADSKTVENKTFKETVKEIAIDIEGYNKVDETEKSIEIGVSGNEIKFYYTKRTDLSYKVNYLEKDTNRVLADSKVVSNQALGAVILSKDEVIEIDGYNFNSTDKGQITITTGENVINVYYTKVTGLSYKVNYLDKATNEVIQPAKVKGEQVFESVINAEDEAVEIAGYNYDSSDKPSITITTGENVLNLYYNKRTDFSYTVKYVDAEGKELKPAKVEENRTFREKVIVNAEAIEGYNPDRASKEIIIGVNENEIIFTYTKRNDLSYTVKYVDVEGKELKTAKVEGNQTYAEKVTVKAEAIDGYTPDSESKEITIGVNVNEITFTYTKISGLSYKVNFLEKGTDKLIHEQVTKGDKTFEDAIKAQDEVIGIEGYSFDSSDKPSITITTGENVLNLYYCKRADLSYTVKYLEKDNDSDNSNNKVLAAEKVVNNQVFESKITEKAIDIDGYNKVDPAEKELTIAVSGNEIVFYYSKRTDLSYTVKYLEKDTNAKLADNKTVENKTFEETVKETAIDVDGYNKVDPAEKELTIAVSGNEIVFYYSKRTDLSYTVKYLEKDNDNKLAEDKLVEGKTFKETITEKAIDISGYNKVDPTEKSITIEVSGNEIVFYYSKRTDLSYTVKYLEKDNDENDSNNTVLHEEKVVSGKTFKETITEKAIDISGYNKVDPSEKSITIEVSGNEITFYYTKKSDLSYTVKYLEKDTNVELTEPKTVVGQVFGSTVKENAIDIDGYNKVDPAEKSIVIAIEGNEIIFFYTKRIDLSYTVNYLEKDTNKVLKESKTVSDKTFKEVINSEDEKTAITGYDFNSFDKETLTISTKLEENVINIYYTKGKFNYTVEYYFDNEIDNSKTDTIEATFEDEITSYKDKNIAGYKLDKVDGLPLTITELPGMNIIKVYYVKDVFDYTVNYYYDETLNAEKAEKLTGIFGTSIDTYKDKVEAGYELDRVENLPLTITKNPEENVINVFYRRKDAQVIIKYVDKATGEEISDKVTKQGKVFDNFDVMEDKKDIDGYTLIENPNPSTGRYEEKAQERTFYYAKNTKVIVKYLEKESNAQVAKDIIIEGFEGKDYVTAEQKVDNYACVDNSGELNGKMTRDEITVIYYYLQNTKVVVKHIDQISGQVLASAEQTGLVGDEFTSSAKDFEGYALVEKPENETVIMAKDIITLNYYYKKISAGVIEKHIDIKSGELLDSTIYEGKEGDSYKTESKDFYGYDIFVDKLPENAEGEMTVDVIEVRYYYIRKASVKVEYLDKATGKVINETYQLEERDSTEYLRGYEGDQYKTVEKQFKGYDIVPELYPNNTEGVMQVVRSEDGKVVTETVVRYYYAYKSEVKERHIDITTGKVLEEVTHNGHEGDYYEIPSKAIDGYDLVKEKLPTNARGKMSIDPIAVNYYYIRNASVKVEYLDVNTNEVLIEKAQVPGRPGIYTQKDSTEIIKGHEGDNYASKEKSFEDYTIVTDKYPMNWKGVMGDTEIVVRYYYVHKSAGVVEKHMDAMTGKSLEKDILHEGNEGDSYKTSSKEFKGYDLVTSRLPQNAEGIMGRQETVVKYYYIRKVTVTIQYLEENTNNKLEADKILEIHEGERYYTESKKIAGYEMTKRVGDKDGIVGNEDVTIKFYYKKVEASKPTGNTTSNNNTNNNANNNTNTTVKVPNNNGGTTVIVQQPSGNNSGFSLKDLPDTGDMLPFIAGGVILLVAVVNAIISTVRKKRNK